MEWWRAQSSRTPVRVGPFGASVVAWRTAGFAATAMLVEDAINETAGLELVQFPDPDAEHLMCSVVNLPLVEVMLGDEFEDEIPLFVRAGPGVAVDVGGMPVAVGGSALTIVVAIAGRFPVDPVSIIGDKTRVLDLLVNALLERLVEAGAFGRHVVNVADLGLDGDRELVARIPRQAEAFRVIGNEFECHGFLSIGWFWTQKSPTMMAGHSVLVGDVRQRRLSIPG